VFYFKKYNMKRILAVPLLLLFLLSNGKAGEETTVYGIRYSSYKTYTRVVVDITGSINYTQNRLSNPDRLYFDLKNCILSKKIPSSISINDGILKTVRIAQFNKKTVRVVFDVKKFDHFYAFMLEEPYRLVIDIYTPEIPLLPERKNIKKRKVPFRARTIVIDPGHGGRDPGAVGPRGLKEKDVVLDIAKKLGRILKERYNLKVIYTRTRDVFIPLNERTEIANSNKADLFISIHTNASRKRYTRGIETYILNWTNDEEAMRVAARENAISYKKMKKVQNELQIILQDLARNTKRDESIVLARSVQDSMIKILKRNYRITDLGVKQALFYVLVGAEMPSILVEVSFITNREEERRLSRNSYRNKIAEAIAKGIINYINTQSTLFVRKLGDST